MYALKQIVGALAGPMTMALLVCAVALVLRWRKRPRAARWCLALAAALTYLLSIDPVADLLLEPLEARYAPWPGGGANPPRFVVVLGSSYSPRASLPPTAALDSDGLARVVEGVRLCRALPDCRLVLSGGAPAGRIPSARGYQRIALDLGIEERRIRVLDAPLDTASESREIAAVVGSEPCLLVTSASHMPRAMWLMRMRGLNALPAPTAHTVNTTTGYGLASLLPGSSALRKSERALHEYLGLAALALGAEK